jgi:hypothetical protein
MLQYPKFAFLMSMLLTCCVVEDPAADCNSTSGVGRHQITEDGGDSIAIVISDKVGRGYLANTSIGQFLNSLAIIGIEDIGLLAQGEAYELMKKVDQRHSDNCLNAYSASKFSSLLLELGVQEVYNGSTPGAFLREYANRKLGIARSSRQGSKVQPS